MMDGLSDYDYVQVTAWRGLTTSRPRRLAVPRPRARAASETGPCDLWQKEMGWGDLPQKE